MRLAFFDCFSGISGDMALAALVHAGADLDTITSVVRSLPIDDVMLEAEEVEVRGISALRLHVHAGQQSVIRTYASMRELLTQARIPPGARRLAQRMYHRLAHAAAAIHGKEPELVTFQEFGDVDCLVEFVGSALALDMLGVERVFASAIPTGMGMARTEHGIMPIPSPIVMELLHGVPTYSRGIPVELVSPAGAAFLSAVSEGYGDMPTMRADHVGYGAGHLRLDFPNALRVVIGEEHRVQQMPRGGSLSELAAANDVIVEATLVALDGRAIDELLAGLIEAGARDGWSAPVVGRGGQHRTAVTALVGPSGRESVIQVLRDQGLDVEVRVTPVLTSPATP